MKIDSRATLAEFFSTLPLQCFFALKFHAYGVETFNAVDSLIELLDKNIVILLEPDNLDVLIQAADSGRWSSTDRSFKFRFGRGMDSEEINRVAGLLWRGLAEACKTTFSVLISSKEDLRRTLQSRKPGDTVIFVFKETPEGALAAGYLIDEAEEGFFDVDPSVANSLKLVAHRVSWDNVNIRVVTGFRSSTFSIIEGLSRVVWLGTYSIEFES